MTPRGDKISVAELMLRPDVHGRRRPEDLEVLELAYRMRRRVGPEVAAPRRRIFSPAKVFALVAGLVVVSALVVLVSL